MVRQTVKNSKNIHEEMQLNLKILRGDQNCLELLYNVLIHLNYTQVNFLMQYQKMIKQSQILEISNLLFSANIVENKLLPLKEKSTIDERKH